MIVRRLATRGGGAGPERTERKKSRTWRYLLVTIGAGIISGLAALAGIWPFTTLPALLVSLRPQPGREPINASSIFPPVQPVHKVIDVYDPPPPAPRQGNPPQPPSSSPKPKTSPTPTPLKSTPTPTPPDD